MFGNVYAFTADGLTQRQLRDYVEDVRAKVLTVPNVGKVNLIGAQDEVIFLEFSTREMAALGISQQDVMQTLQAQNAITPSGVIQAGPERISVRVTGQFTSEESLRDLNLRINDRFFRLSDVATISRGYVDPPQALFRFNGQPAIGLAIGMKTGANLLKFGEALKEQMDRIIGELPIGVGVHLVADQPIVVEEAVGGFTKALFEAVAIVLVVSFISLGMRAGLVVALVDPARARHDLRGHAVYRHLAAAHLAWRPHHRARSSGRRCHDRRRDDGGAAGGRRHAAQGCHRRLHLDRVPDADRNARSPSRASSRSASTAAMRASSPSRCSW